jgi:Ca2+-binding EF-hand superfamily protein
LNFLVAAAFPGKTPGASIMFRMSVFVVVLVFSLAALSAVCAADQDTPKKAPPAIEELLKLSPEEFIKQFDKNKDGVLTADELPPGLARAFERADANGDGKLDVKEVGELLKILKQRFSSATAEPGPAMKAEIENRVKDILERMDTNKDGKISKEEAKGMVAENFERLDLNKDGFVDREELTKAVTRILAMQGGPGGTAGPGGPSIPEFDPLDRNADGRLTREELKGTPYADKFDEIDTNKDGKIDPKEWAAYFKKQAEKQTDKKAP